jgi:SWI/SNF-related matrix-associated actin-dependent regulator of chromatin subfamily A protein 2/4
MKEEGKELDVKATIAKASTMDDEYESRKGSDANYYSIAHTFREAVTEQPSIMAFGQLKEYQVRIILQSAQRLS